MNIFNNEKEQQKGTEDIIFHYNREHRLSFAPQSVKDYYEGKMQIPAKGIFKTLISTKINRAILAGMVICFLGIGSLFLTRQSNSCVIDGISVTVNAFEYLDSVYVSISFVPENNVNSAFLSLSAVVKAKNIEKNVIDSKKVSGIYEGKNNSLGISFSDCDIVSVETDIMIGDETKTIKTVVNKN